MGPEGSPQKIFFGPGAIGSTVHGPLKDYLLKLIKYNTFFKIGAYEIAPFSSHRKHFQS
jgi:hypothetical protein